MKQGRSSVMVIILHSRNTAREYVDRLGNQAYPMIQKLFSYNDAVFQDGNIPIHTAALHNCTIGQILQSALKMKNS
jgi:hypothetical protein